MITYHQSGGKLPRGTIFAIASWLGDAFDLARLLLSLEPSRPRCSCISEISCRTIRGYLLALQKTQGFAKETGNSTEGPERIRIALSVDERRVVDHAIRSRKGGPIHFDRAFRRVLNFVKKLVKSSDADLNLTIVASSLCSRITPLTLLPIFTVLQPNLIGLSIISRDPQSADHNDFTLLRYASTSEGSPKLLSWPTRSHWTASAETCLDSWHDPHTWRSLPCFTRLRSLLITGPSSVLWIAALRDIAFPSLLDLTLQTWCPNDVGPAKATRSENSEKEEVFSDFLSNCPRMLDLRLLQPPDVWGPTTMQAVLRQAARICRTKSLQRVHLCPSQIGRYSFNALADPSDCDSISTRDSDSNQAPILHAQESALCALYHHLALATDTLRRLRACEAKGPCQFYPLSLLQAPEAVTAEYSVLRRVCKHSQRPPTDAANNLGCAEPQELFHDSDQGMKLGELCQAAILHGEGKPRSCPPSVDMSSRRPRVSFLLGC